MTSAAVRLALAKAVARPGARAGLLNRDNGVDGWVPVVQAVRLHRAFTVEVSADVLAVDQDSELQAPALEALADQLRDVGVRPVVVESGRKGGLHLFAHFRDRRRLAEFQTRARQSGLDVRHAIRPPLTPHRLGLPVRMYDPLDPREALVRLGQSLGSRKRLSTRMYRLLREGDRDSRYQSTSEVAMAIAWGAVNRGWSEEALYAALVRPRNIGGIKVQKIVGTRGIPAARAYVRRLFHGAVAAVEQHPADAGPQVAALRAHLRRFLELIDQVPWIGMAGATDHRVLTTHVAIAAGAGSATYTASTRQIAEEADITRRTVVTSHRRLQRDGWLICTSLGVGTCASSWRLPAPARFSPLTAPPGGAGGACG